MRVRNIYFRELPGGHDSSGYELEEYDRGRMIVFRFASGLGVVMPRFDGAPGTPGGAVLTQALGAQTEGRMTASWAASIRRLHDAMTENALDRVELATSGRGRRPTRGSAWARVQRALSSTPARRSRHEAP